MEAGEASLSIAQGLPNDIIVRSRAFDHGALMQVFDASYDGAYEVAHALTGDHEGAAAAVDAALGRALDQLAGYAGDAATLPAWLQELTRQAVRRRPRPVGADSVRDDLGRLSDAEHQAVVLRVLGGCDVPAIAAATGRRQASVEASLLAGLRLLSGGGGRLTGANAVRQLEVALDRLESGTDPREAANAAPALPEAAALLRSAAKLMALPAEAPTAAGRARARVHFLAEADARRVHWVHRHHAVAEVPGRRPPKRRPVLSTMSLGFVLFLSLVAGVALAVASAIATPSSSVYPLKRTAEDALVALAPDRVTRASLEVKLAEQRREEAETEAAGHHPDAAITAARGRYDALLAAAYDLEAVSRHSKSWIDARNRLETEAQQPPAPLERMLEANGGKAQAQQLAAMATHFQAQREQFDKVIAPAPTNAGQQPQPGASPSPTPPK